MGRLFSALPLKLITLHIALLFSAIVCSEPSNLTLVKNEIRTYHDSGLYEKELTLTVKQAQKYILAQAIHNQQEKHQQKLAIILDIDETSLSNYPTMIKRDFTGTKEQFHKDIMAANAPAIQPVLSLYKEAIEHGVDVFFITGRNESEREATERNLRNAGYSQWAGLFLRPVNYSSKSIVPFKSHTRELISQKGYMILASIGDQYSDLLGGYAQKGFKLPNPFYYLP